MHVKKVSCGVSGGGIRDVRAGLELVTEERYPVPCERGCRNWSAQRSKPSPHGSEIAVTNLRRQPQARSTLAVREVVEPGWVAVMRERRRRRAEAEGRPHVEPLREPPVLANGSYPSWAEVMRAHRARRCAESRRAGTAAE
jgi:hypothetical protein